MTEAHAIVEDALDSRTGADENPPMEAPVLGRVLVTGAGGFIGRHLVSHLSSRGVPVRELLRQRTRDSGLPLSLEICEADVRNASGLQAALTGCNTVFHLAGKAHDLSRSAHSDAEYRAVNVDGTANVLRAALEAGVRRFVFVSSVKAMGEGSEDCLDETADPRPASAYGRSKLEGEDLVEEVGGRAGLHVATLRLPLVYGPGAKGNLHEMLAAIDRGAFPPLPRVPNRRSLVSAADVACAAVLAACTPIASGRRYIVTDGHPYSSRELYDEIRAALGRPPVVWSVPLAALRALAGAGDLFERITERPAKLDRAVLGKLLGSAWYSNERICRELGFRPSMTFRDALPAIVAEYRACTR